MQITVANRTAYDLGLLLPSLLSDHESAWLTGNKEACDCFREALKKVRQGFIEWHEKNLLARVDAILEKWKEFLWGDEHLGWAAAHDMLFSQVRLEKQSRLTIGEFLVNSAYTSLQYRGLPTKGFRPLEKDPIQAALQSELSNKGQLPWDKAAAIVAKNTYLILEPSAGKSSSRAKDAKRGVCSALEKLGDLISVKPEIRNLSDPSPPCEYFARHALTGAIVLKSPVFADLETVGVELLKQGAQRPHPEPIWFCLGVHLSLLEHQPQVPARFLQQPEVLGQTIYPFSGAYLMSCDDVQGLAEIILQEIARLELPFGGPVDGLRPDVISWSQRMQDNVSIEFVRSPVSRGVSVGIEAGGAVVDQRRKSPEEKAPHGYCVEAKWGTYADEKSFRSGAESPQTASSGITVLIRDPHGSPQVYSVKGCKKGRLLMSLLYKQYRIASERERLRSDEKGLLGIGEIGTDSKRENCLKTVDRLADGLAKQGCSVKVQKHPAQASRGGRGQHITHLTLTWQDLPPETSVGIMIPPEFELKPIWPRNSDRDMQNSDR